MVKQEKKTIKKTLVKKATVKKEPVKEKKPKEEEEKYFQAIGRRKTSTARIRLYTKGNKGFVVNDKKLEDYFKTEVLQKTILAPLEKMKSSEKFSATVLVKGGGVNSQAEAVRHGIARALVVFNNEYKKKLRKAGYLTRDPRMKERKKFGLKRARRAPQWSKR